MAVFILPSFSRGIKKKVLTSGLSANFFFVTLFKLSSIPFVDFLRISSDWSTNTTVWPLAAATWKLKKIKIQHQCHKTMNHTDLCGQTICQVFRQKSAQRCQIKCIWLEKIIKVYIHYIHMGWCWRDKYLKQLEGKGKRNLSFPHSLKNLVSEGI